MITALEWLGFGGTLISAWLYGTPGQRGPALGVVAAGTILAWALMTGTLGAAIANVGFMLIHVRNWMLARRGP